MPEEALALKPWAYDLLIEALTEPAEPELGA
jgi:hypothetical protein